MEFINFKYFIIYWNNCRSSQDLVYFVENYPQLSTLTLITRSDYKRDAGLISLVLFGLTDKVSIPLEIKKKTRTKLRKKVVWGNIIHIKGKLSFFIINQILINYIPQQEELYFYSAIIETSKIFYFKLIGCNTFNYFQMLTLEQDGYNTNFFLNNFMLLIKFQLGLGYFLKRTSINMIQFLNLLDIKSRWGL